MKDIIRILCILIGIGLSCGFLFFVIFYFKIKTDVNTNLQIVSETKSHPWIHRQRDYNPPGDSPLVDNDIFFIKTDKVQEASALLKNNSFYDLANCEFFYFTGHVDFKKNNDQKYYLVRSVKEKHANGQTFVSVDSNHNLYVGYGFLWGFQFEMNFVDNPIVVRLPHRPNQVYVDFIAAK
jgi:hypothetical protein